MKHVQTLDEIKIGDLYFVVDTQEKDRWWVIEIISRKDHYPHRYRILRSRERPNGYTHEELNGSSVHPNWLNPEGQYLLMEMTEEEKALAAL